MQLTTLEMDCCSGLAGRKANSGLGPPNVVLFSHEVVGPQIFQHLSPCISITTPGPWVTAA
jgi:hypothetical protein